MVAELWEYWPPTDDCHVLSRPPRWGPIFSFRRSGPQSRSDLLNAALVLADVDSCTTDRTSIVLPPVVPLVSSLPSPVSSLGLQPPVSSLRGRAPPLTNACFELPQSPSAPLRHTTLTASVRPLSRTTAPSPSSPRTHCVGGLSVSDNTSILTAGTACCWKAGPGRVALSPELGMRRSDRALQEPSPSRPLLLLLSLPPAS